MPLPPVAENQACLLQRFLQIETKNNCLKTCFKISQHTQDVIEGVNRLAMLPSSTSLVLTVFPYPISEPESHYDFVDACFKYLLMRDCFSNFVQLDTMWSKKMLH